MIDGKLLTEPVPDTYAAGKQAHVPLLAGWNADEGSFFAMRGMTAENGRPWPAGLFKERSAEFLKLYPGDDGCAGTAFGHRLRQRLLHRLRHLEVARGAQQDGRRAGLSLSLRTGGARPASFIPAPLPSTPTTSSTCSERSIRGPARRCGPRIAS